MTVFTFHLAKTSVTSTLKALWSPPKAGDVPGLIHAECMVSMTLGSQIFSPSRILLRQLVVFAQWENESAIDNFLANDSFGKTLAKGWHVRLVYLRQWGNI